VPQPSEVEFFVDDPLIHSKACPLKEHQEAQQVNSSMKTDDLVLGGKLAIPNPFARGGGGCNICGREAHESCDICDGDTKVSAFIKEIKHPINNGMKK
jgi:hypothetical protein